MFYLNQQRLYVVGKHLSRRMIISLTLVALVYIQPSVLSQTTYFNRTIDIGGIFGAGHTIIPIDTGYYISGVVGGGRINVGLLSIDLEGNKNWLKTVGKAGFDYYAGRPGSFKEVDDHFILGGSIAFADSSIGHFIKYDRSGDTILTSDYLPQSSNELFFNNSSPTLDSNYIFTGEVLPQIGYADALILKTDKHGNEIWRNYYGWNTADGGFSVFQTLDSGYVVGGYTYMPGLEDSGQPLIVKFDKEGNYLWNKKPGGPLDDDKAMVCASADSNIMALTTYNYTTYGGGECGRINVIKLNQQGNILWNKKYADIWDGRIAGNIKLLPDSGYICCGSVIDSSHTQYFGWILRINSHGDSIWYREYAYHDHDFGINYLYDITPTADNGFIACGQAYAFPPNNLQKIWVLKVDSLGCDTSGCDPTVGIEDGRTVGRYDDNTMGIELWPNPASTQISVSLTSRQSSVVSRQSMGRFTMEVYDIFGRKVSREILSSTRMGGGREGGWKMDVSALPPGLYLLVLKDGMSVLVSAKFVVAR